MTQHQIDRKYAKSLVISAIMLILAIICVAVWIAGLFINNNIMAIVGGCVGAPLLISGLIYTAVKRHEYKEQSGEL